MRKRLSKVLLTFLAAGMLFSTTPTLAKKVTVNMPKTLHSGVEEKILSSGVTHERIKRFTSAGWYNINVIRADLTNEYVDIKGLFNKEGIPRKDTVSGMVQKSDAVAGINGDFFNTRPASSSMGTLINDSEVISSPVEMAYALPTFYINKSNEATIGYMDRLMVANNKNGGQRVIINTINKVTRDFTSVTLLNKHWGKHSIGRKYHKDLIEVVVVDDVVEDVRVGKNAVPIPENGYVLAVRGNNTQKLQSFKKGDKIDLHVGTTPDINTIKFAIGGGSIILKDGELACTNINIKGAHPRSGIGVSEDGEELILVAIDGRNSTFKGVSQEAFGYILRELGAHNALNLDGGGSTAMAVKPMGDEKSEVVNIPSDGAERRVVNSVGVFSDAPIEELSYIELSLSTGGNKMFANTSRTIKAQGYDKHHHKVDIENMDDIVYSVDGIQAELEGNTFKANSSGNAKITAKYGDIKSELDIKVLGKVEDLNASTKNLNLNLNGKVNLPKFTGKDENGFEAPIYARDIEFTTVNEIGKVDGNKFIASEKTEAGILTAKIGNGIENIEISVGSTGKLVHPLDSIEALNSSTYPDSIKASIAISSEAKEGSNSISLNYDFSDASGTRAAYLNFENGLAIGGIPSKLSLWVKGDNSGSWLRGSVVDKNGKSHFINFKKEIDFEDWQLVEANLPSNIAYPIILERIYPVETEDAKKQKGSLLLDHLTAYYPPKLGDVSVPQVSTFKDGQNIKAEVKEGGYSFAVAVDHSGVNKLVDYNAEKDIKARISKNKLAFFLNGVSSNFRDGLSNSAVLSASGAYSTNKHGDVYFIHANSGKGGIRASNPNQWTSLTYQLENREESNIVLFLSTPVFGEGGFKDSLEADLLHDCLAKARENDKNIFVVQAAGTNSSELKDGVRYLKLNTRRPTTSDDLYGLSMIEFVVNPGKTTYQILPLFEKQ